MKINKLWGLVATSAVVAAPLCTVSCTKEETKTWNVSFDTGCETFINTIRVEDGGSVDQPEVKLEKDGYKFGGWFDNEECSGEPYTFGKAINSDLILYAKWDWIDPVEGKKVSIADSEQEIDPTTRTATFECSFDGEDTMIEFTLSNLSLENIVLKETQATVESGKFYVTVIYVPSSNDETITFDLKFAYEIQDQPYLQEIKDLKVTYTEPFVPDGNVEFAESEKSKEVSEDGQRITSIQGTWTGLMPKDYKFDNIQVLYQNNYQEIKIIDPERVYINDDGTFTIRIQYVGADIYGDEQSFSLKFLFTQKEVKSSVLVQDFKLKYIGGEKPEDEGLIYLYNGSTVLFGQSSIEGQDSRNWKCYYFDDKHSTSGKDVTDKTNFYFESDASSIGFEDESNTLSWGNLAQGTYWGRVKAVYIDDDGYSYEAYSSEVAIAIYDFKIYSPALEQTKDEEGNYKDNDSNYYLKSDWKIQVGDMDALSASSASIDIKGEAGIYDKFVWGSNRINPKQITPNGDYIVYLQATYTDPNMGYTFIARSPNIKIKLTRQTK